jgi:WD40 repeat protein
VRFFDGHTGALLVPARRAHTAQVTSLVWSNAAGQPVISGSLDKRAIVWETQDYLPVAVFTRHTMAIDALSTQPNSAVVASASQGGVVRVWRVDTLQELHGFYQDAQVPMRTVAFAPTGNQLAVGGNDGQVRLWSNGLLCQQSATTAQGTLCLDRPQRFHTHTAPVRAIAWSPNGQYLATGGDDGILAVWTCSQEQRPSLLTMAKLASPVLAVSWSPTHQQIAVASGKNVTIWTMHI